MSVAALHANQNWSIRNHIDDRASRTPEAAFLIDPETGNAVTYYDAQDRIRRIAAGLVKHGMRPGDAVAYAFSNSCDAALSVLGALYGGFLATAVNLVAGENTISYVLKHSQSKLVLVDQQSKLAIEKLAAALETKPLIIELGEVVSSIDKAFLPEPVSGDVDGLLMYTSGTTGRPKGVILTQASLLAGGGNTATAHQLKTGDCGLCVLPLYHINAFCVSLMGSLVSGSALVLPRKFSVSTFWDLIRKHECSWFSVVPTQISYLLHNADNPGGDATGCNRLRFGRSASAPLSPDVHAQFEKRFSIPVIETMGLTETAAQILSNPMPPGIRKIGSPGIAYGNEVMIADEQQHPVATGDEGEILVRGQNVLRCYLRNEEATREAITPEGWLRTGDLGRMDEDNYVFVTGRLKELIIKGGENIAPREVDEALYGHPDVVEAAAFAVECKDYGQRVEAGVKVSDPAKVSAQELLDLCHRKIGAFKSPDRIYILPELPKGPSGKIQRIKLAELLKQQSGV